MVDLERLNSDLPHQHCSLGLQRMRKRHCPVTLSTFPSRQHLENAHEATSERIVESDSGGGEEMTEPGALDVALQRGSVLRLGIPSTDMEDERMNRIVQGNPLRD